MKKSLSIILVVLMGLGLVHAQREPIAQKKNKFYDRFTWDNNSVNARKVIPYPYLREADVMWTKRIERVIDTREKVNQPMRWPKNPLYRVIYDNVMNGVITAYKVDDSLTLEFPLTPEEVKKMGSFEEVIQVLIDPADPYAGTTDSIVFNEYKPEKIQKYRIIEDWIFDKKTSEFFPRIIAIAPLYKPVAGSTGIELPEQPMFWLRYEEARELLVNSEVFNNYNDGARMSYDDFFEMRMFSSYIVKENNMYDFAIRDFEEFKNDGVAALLENERIKNDLFIFEHDLWEF
jgi:gliding motility associated protien GldN